jgi:hypothetical protein
VWFLPRGLITAVLGIDVLEARGAQFEFLPSLAFAVILLSNLVLLIGTFRARGIAAGDGLAVEPLESASEAAPGG